MNFNYSNFSSPYNPPDFSQPGSQNKFKILPQSEQTRIETKIEKTSKKIQALKSNPEPDLSQIKIYENKNYKRKLLLTESYAACLKNKLENLQGESQKERFILNDLVSQNHQLTNQLAERENLLNVYLNNEYNLRKEKEKLNLEISYNRDFYIEKITELQQQLASYKEKTEQEILDLNLKLFFAEVEKITQNSNKAS